MDEADAGRIAEELDLTANDIAAACEELDVPRPAVGYWSKLAHGKAPERPALPERAAGEPREVVLGKAPAPDVALPAQETPAAPAAPIVTVHPTLRSLHPAVEALRKALAQRDQGQQKSTSRVGAVLPVTKDMRDRALRILDALARALVSRGHRCRSDEPRGSGHWYSLRVVAVGETVDIQLDEPSKQIVHEHPVLRRGHKLVPSERLRMVLRAEYGVAGLTSWEDRESRPLEELLDRLLLAIGETAAMQAGRRREAEARQRAYEEELARRMREERLATYRKALGEDLLTMATNWSKAQSVLAFLRALEEAVPEAQREKGFDEWMTWARGFAATLDPLANPGRVPKFVDPPNR